jgi:ABC-type multidrug transport system fused ATPase/permease subunit
MVLWPVREAGNLVNLFQRGFAGCDRLFELLDAEPEIADQPEPGAPVALAGAIDCGRFLATPVRPPGSRDRLPSRRSVAIWARGCGKPRCCALVRCSIPAGDAPPRGAHRSPSFVRDGGAARAFLFSERGNAYDDPSRPGRVRAAADLAGATAFPG